MNTVKFLTVLLCAFILSNGLMALGADAFDAPLAAQAVLDQGLDEEFDDEVGGKNGDTPSAALALGAPPYTVATGWSTPSPDAPPAGTRVLHPHQTGPPHA